MGTLLVHSDGVGAHKPRVGGMFQVMFGTAFSNSLGSNFPNNSSPVPQGHNFGGGVGDTFRIRRAQVTVDGSISSQINYHSMVDLAQTGSGSFGPLQDLWIGFSLNRYLRLEVGKQKTGLSEEGQRDDSQLLTIARSIMNEDLPTTAGRIGNIRDSGAALKIRVSRFTGSVGIWNDNGGSADLFNKNRLRFLTGSINVSTLRHFTFGIWGGTNAGGSANGEKRDRAGATALFKDGPHTFEIEGAYARDAAPGLSPTKPGSIAVGWYGLYGFRFSRKWQLVIRYDIWDPAQHDSGSATTESGVFIPQGDHKAKEYTIGVNYYLSQRGSKVQLNYVREDVETNGGNFFGIPRNIILGSAQFVF